MQHDKSQQAALAYARSVHPLDPEMGWRREDVQLAFMAGMSALSVPRLLSAKEVATILNASLPSVHGLVRRGELAYVPIGRGAIRKHMCFQPSEIEAFIKRKAERISYSQPAASMIGATGTDFMTRRQARIADRVAARKAKKGEAQG